VPAVHMHTEALAGRGVQLGLRATGYWLVAYYDRYHRNGIVMERKR